MAQNWGLTIVILYIPWKHKIMKHVYEAHCILLKRVYEAHCILLKHVYETHCILLKRVYETHCILLKRCVFVVSSAPQSCPIMGEPNFAWF